MSNAKVSCPNCSQHLEFDPADVGQVVPCPNCEREIKLHHETPPALVAVAAQLAAVKVPGTSGTSSKDKLASVRHAGCYKFQRKFIEAGFALLIVLTVATSGIFFMQDQIGMGRLVFLSIIILGAIEQAMALLFDIADATLAGHAKATSD